MSRRKGRATRKAQRVSVLDPKTKTQVQTRLKKLREEIEARPEDPKESAASKLPSNALISESPDETINHCRKVLEWLCAVEQPFANSDLDFALMLILQTVADALEHAENACRTDEVAR